MSAWGNSWGVSWGVSWGGLRVPTFQQIWIIDERTYHKKRKVKRAKKAVTQAIEVIADINQIIVKNTTTGQSLDRKLKQAAEQIKALETEQDFLDVQKRLLRALELNLAEAIKRVKFGGVEDGKLTVSSFTSSQNIYEVARWIEEQDDLETLQLFMMLV